MLRLLIVVPFFLALVIFALGNTDAEQVWFATNGWKVPFGLVGMGIGAAFFLLGAFSLWLGELRQRRRARKAENQVRQLQSQLLELHTRLDNHVAVQNAANNPSGAVV